MIVCKDVVELIINHLDTTAIYNLCAINKNFYDIVNPLTKIHVVTNEFVMPNVVFYMTHRRLYKINHTLSCEIVYNCGEYSANICSYSDKLNGIFYTGIYSVFPQYESIYVYIENNIVRNVITIYMREDKNYTQVYTTDGIYHIYSFISYLLKKAGYISFIGDIGRIRFRIINNTIKEIVGETHNMNPWVARKKILAKLEIFLKKYNADHKRLLKIHSCRRVKL